ncbi:MAG TPA: hypothetical protein VD862_00605 [Candidatus Paceibacterota bacterium]|nr:hypothetical protein [Candidatus Paceibacterota bacterium]
MSHRAVLEYITAGRACGLTDHDIAVRLEGAGWTSADVQDAFTLAAKMDDVPAKPEEKAWCPPDNARSAPVPTVKDKVLGSRTPRTSAVRYAAWLSVALVAFLFGFSIMR